MADNVSFQSATPATIPAATSIATDDVSGDHYQRIKVDLGGDGASSPLVRGQQADANSIPVTLSSEQAAFLDGLETLLSPASSFDHGSNRDVDATAEQITSSSVAATKGVLVRADPANTGIVYVGNSDVTAGTTDATDGFPLQAGESLLVQVNNANLIYVIGSAANQIVYWMTV